MYKLNMPTLATNNMEVQMDSTDWIILKILQEDGRINVTDLSSRINLSRSSTSERLAKLFDNGVIERVSAVVSPSKLGHNVTFYMNISNIKGSVDHVVQILKRNPYVTEIHSVIGELNFIAKASMPSIELMHPFLGELIKHCHVVTSIVLDSPLAFRPMMPHDEFETDRLPSFRRQKP